MLLTHPHLRHQWRQTDHHATDGDKLVNVLRVEEAHVLGLLCIVRPDLNLVLQLGVWVQEHKQLIDSHVQDRHHLLWVADQLPIQLWAKPSEVSTVEGQERLLQSVDLMDSREMSLTNSSIHTRVLSSKQSPTSSKRAMYNGSTDVA